MSRDFDILQFELGQAEFKTLSGRQRHQIVGCMHAHNELSVLNRILMFSLNDVGEGELHDAAHGVQMWCIMQVLAGKLIETWTMFEGRVLKAYPEDPVLAALSKSERENLNWLKDYFKVKQNPLRIIRDKTGFHYDKLNLDEASAELVSPESRIYLAQHPANASYYAGSALVFRSVFAMIGSDPTKDRQEWVKAGIDKTFVDIEQVNWHLHDVLYGIIGALLAAAFGKPLDEIERTRIPVKDARKASQIALPMFIDIGGDDDVGSASNAVGKA